MYFTFAFHILHLHLYRKTLSVMVKKHEEGDGEDIGPRNACRRSERGRKPSLQTNSQQPFSLVKL